MRESSAGKKGVTREEVKAALDEGRIKKPKKGFVKTVVGNLWLRGILGLLTLGTAAEGARLAYQHNMIPGIHYAEKTLVPDLIFDNTKAEGVIGAITETTMPQSEINALYPDAFAEINDGRNTLQMQSILDTNTSSKPDANIAYVRDFHGAGLFDIPGKIAECRKEGYRDQIGFENVPSLTMITSPVDGMLTLYRYEDVPNPSNGSDITVAGIDFVAPNGNHYRVAISGEIAKKRTSFVFKSIANSPSLSIENTYDDKLISTSSNTVEIKKGDSIMQVIEAPGSRIDVSLQMTIAREGKIGEGINMQNSPIPTNVKLFTTQDGKILVPSGN